MILVVVMFTIFEAYTKNNIMIEAQLRVDLGWYFLPGVFLI